MKVIGPKHVPARGHLSRPSGSKPAVSVVKYKPPVVTKVSPLQGLYKTLVGQIKTPDQLQADAERMAGTQTTASQDFIRTESQRLRDEADRRRQLIMNAMLAAAGENAKMAPQVLGGYQSAAATLGGLAGAATGSVGDAMRADNAAQTAALANVGVAGPTLDTQQEGVENYSGGYLPASNLAAMGANANAGMLGQVAAQRMGAVEIPAKDYEETLASLDDQELSQLAEIEKSRPDLVAKILDNLSSNQATISKSIIAIETEKRQIAAARAKISQARAELQFKYAQLMSQATTAREKQIATNWRDQQKVMIDTQANAIDQQEANIKQQNANTSSEKLTWQENHPNSTLGGKQTTVDSIVAKSTSSWKDRPQGNDPNVIADNIWIKTRGQLPKAQWPALRARLRAWAKSLPIRQTSGGGWGGGS